MGRPLVDISHWPARRLQNVTMLIASLVVLAVVLVWMWGGWRWAVLVAIGLALAVLRPLRHAVVAWWDVNGVDRR